MPFENRAGLAGKVYVPPVVAGRKHNCPDCFSCQICSDDRCAVCRGEEEHLARHVVAGPVGKGECCRCRVR